MTAFRIGLVVEGPTDSIVLRALLSGLIYEHNPSLEITFVDLQPSIDGTSGSKEGGWQLVYQWCLNNAPDFRAVQFFGPGLFSTGENPKHCDLLIVQMDSDICSLLSTGGFAPSATSPLTTPADRGNYIYSAINGWLWPDLAASDGKHIIAPTVESMETWLIAALGDHDDPEYITKPGRILAEIDFARRGKPISSATKRIAKRPERYQPLADDASRKVQQIQNRCFWFAHLTRAILAHTLSRQP